MHTPRRPFLPLFVALCFLIVGCGPRKTSEADIVQIKANLAEVYTAGNAFMLETGKPEARYADLTGKIVYLHPMQPVNGENYTALVVNLHTTSLSVKTADGQEITWTTSR